MKLEKLIKREISITIVTVLIVVLLFISFSYAIFKVDAEGEAKTITFGNIAMSFCIDETCDTGLEENVDNIIGTKKNEDGSTSYVPIYPQTDPTTPEEWSALDPYTFKLKNTGSLPLYVTLYLEKDTTSGLEFTTNTSKDGYEFENKYNVAVDDDQIKVAIGEDGVETPTTNIFGQIEKVEGTEKHILTKNILIEANNEKTFHLYAWLRNDANNAAQGKYFVTKISAKGEYLPEEKVPKE